MNSTKKLGQKLGQKMRKFSLKICVRLGLIAGGLGSIAITSPVLAQGGWPGGWNQWNTQSFLNQNQNYIEGVQVPWAAQWTGVDDELISVIQNFVNRVLGILGLIALIFLLYGGFMIVTAGNKDDAYQKWVTILKNAAIGIAFIGVARFIVSILFRLVNLITQT